MEYYEFLKRIIDEGIDAAKADYTDPNDKQHLDGSIAGFEACRNKLPEELVQVWTDVSKQVNMAFGDPEENYWYHRCYQLEVEWVINVVSAMLVNEGQDPLLSWLPTANGMMKAASIIGVQSK
jgi:hypothetical protein